MHHPVRVAALVCHWWAVTWELNQRLPVIGAALGKNLSALVSVLAGFPHGSDCWGDLPYVTPTVCHVLGRRFAAGICHNPPCHWWGQGSPLITDALMIMSQAAEAGCVLSLPYSADFGVNCTGLRQ